MAIRSLLAFVVATGLAAAVLSAQGGVAGNWAITVDSPQGATHATLSLAVNGDALKGTIGSDMGTTPFTGTVKGNEVRFQFDYSGPSGPITIVATATVSGNEIKGAMDYGQGAAPFAGKRIE
jgi:hypothetical protein